MSSTVAYMGSIETNEAVEANGFQAFIQMLGVGSPTVEELKAQIAEANDGRDYVFYRVLIEKVEG